MSLEYSLNTQLGLINELRKLPAETEWVEFKHNNADPEEIGEYQLPAPLFEITNEHTRAVLFAHQTLKTMDKADRIRACYLHACLRYVQREKMTNSSLRERFGIDEKNMATASRLIKEALDAGAVIPYDAKAARKQMKYLPFWAK